MRQPKMSMCTARLLAVCLAAALVGQSCATPPGSPAGRGRAGMQAVETPLPAGAGRVEAVRGLLLAEDAQTPGRWLPVQAGALLPAGARLRTGADEGAGARIARAGGEVWLVGSGAQVEWRAEGPVCTAGRMKRLDEKSAPGPQDAPKDAWADALKNNLSRDLRLPRLEAQAAEDGKHAALEMKSLALDVREDAGVAHVTVDMVFTNRAERNLEGTFFYAVPEGALITGFEMLNGDRWVRGEVVEREKARQVFEYIKRQQRDPGLLEWAGGNLFKMRVYPIPAKGDKRIRLTLAQALPAAADGSRVFQFPLAGESFRSVPLAQLEVHAASTAGQVASPSHALAADKDRPQGKMLLCEKVVPGNDLTLVFPGGAGQQSRLIPGQRAAEGSPFEKDAGTFLLRLPVGGSALADQKIQRSAKADPPLVLLLDGTASMGAAPFQTALAAAQTLREMNPGRSVKLAILGQDDPTSNAPLALTDIPDAAALRQAAKRRLPIGGNDFSHDLRRLAAALDAAKLAEAQVVYVGDGVPSLGEAGDSAALAREAAKALGAGRNLSAIAIGAQADTSFLRQLSAAAHGRTVALSEARHAPDAVADLLDATARMGKVKVRFEGPANLPPLGAIHGDQADDLRPGSELLITGRVPLEWDGREVAVITTGEFEGQPFERRETMRFALQSDGTRADLPRLWAAAHLHWLLEEAQAPALWRREQAIATSVAYQIPSPITSYLVLENEEDYARYGIARNTRRVDWRGETVGLKAAVVKVPKVEDGDKQEANSPHSPLEVPMPEVAVDPTLPKAFWTRRMMEMFAASELDVPGLRAMLWGENSPSFSLTSALSGSGGGGGGGADIFKSDDSGSSSFKDAPSFSLAKVFDGGGPSLGAQLRALDVNPPSTPERDAQGWGAMVFLEQNPTKSSGPIDGWGYGGGSAFAKLFVGAGLPDNGFLDTWLSGNQGYTNVFVDDEGYPENRSLEARLPAAGSPWQSDIRVAGCALSDARLLPLPLARRAVRLRGGDDAAGMSAKLGLFRSLIATTCRSKAQLDAHQTEALALVRHFLAHGPDDSASRGALRLWEAQLTDDSRARADILWDVVAPGRGKAAVGDAGFIPAFGKTTAEQTPAESAMYLLRQEKDPSTLAAVGALYWRLADRRSQSLFSDWGSASALADDALAAHMIEDALDRHGHDAAILLVALDCAVRVRPNDIVLLNRVMDALLASSPHAVCDAAAASAMRRLGREEEVWALAGKVREGGEKMADDACYSLLQTLCGLDDSRGQAMGLEWLKNADGVALRAACRRMADNNGCAQAWREAAAKRLAAGDIPLALRLQVLRTIDDQTREKNALSDRSVLLPALALMEGDGADIRSALEAFGSIMDGLTERELEAWIPRVDAAEKRLASLRETEPDAGMIFGTMRHAVDARRRLSQLRHQAPLDFLREQWAQAATAGEALALMDEVSESDVRAGDLFPLLADLDARFPQCLAGDPQGGRSGDIFYENGRLERIVVNLIRENHLDLARKLQAMCQPRSSAVSACAADLCALQAQLAQGDLPATAMQAQTLLAKRQAELPALASAMAKAAADLDAALVADALPNPPEFPYALPANLDATEAQLKAVRAQNNRQWLAYADLVKARDLRLKSPAGKADAAAVAWGAAHGQCFHLRDLLDRLAKANPQACAIELERLAMEAKNEDPVLREATTGRLKLLDATAQWAALRAETCGLSAADPQDPVWARWQVHACEKAGDHAGALAALKRAARLEPLDSELQLRLLAAELPGLAHDEALRRAKRIDQWAFQIQGWPMELTGWFHDCPEAVAAYWHGQPSPDQPSRPQSKDADALWKAITDEKTAGMGNLPAYEQELEDLLPSEETQTLIGARIRGWKPQGKVATETAATILLLKAKLAALETRADDRKALLRQAGDLVSTAIVSLGETNLSSCRDRIMDRMVEAGMMEDAVNGALRLAGEEGNVRTEAVSHLLQYHQPKLSPAQELRLREAQHDQAQARIVELLHLLKRTDEADARAAGFAPELARKGEWYEIEKITELSRFDARFPRFKAWQAAERKHLAAQLAHYLETGEADPAASKDWRSAGDAMGSAWELFGPVFDAAEKGDNLDILMRIERERGRIIQSLGNHADENVPLWRRIVRHPGATVAQKVYAWNCLLSYFHSDDNTEIDVFEIITTLDALSPETVDARRLRKFKILTRLGRLAEADAVAQAWIDASPLATPEKRRAVAALLLKVEASGFRPDAESLMRESVNRFEELASAASFCDSFLWAARANSAAFEIRRAMGEQISPEELSQNYQSVADAYWQANRPDEAAEAACDGLALYVPVTIQEGSDNDSANHDLAPAYWSFHYCELIGLGDTQIASDHLKIIETHFLEKILPAKGDHPNIRLALALAFDKLSQPARALPHWRAMVELAPAEPVWRKRLIGHLLEANQLDEAQAACLDWLAFDPRALDAHGLLADILSKRKLPGLAARAGAADAQPLEADGHNLYADALAQVGHKAEAIAELRRAIAARPSRFAPVAALAAMLGAQDQKLAMFEAGLAACNKAIADLPEDPQPYLDKVRFLRALGKREEALDLLDWIQAHPWPRFWWETRREARELRSE